MNRTLASMLLLVSFGCATIPATPPAASPEPTAATPCTPGVEIVNASLWVQSSAEYQAAALGTYANARRALDAALADPTWNGASEESGTDPAQPPAVILDLDETAIDNSAFGARNVKRGITYNPEIWKAWVDEAAAEAVPGAKEFLDYAKSRGVTPFYVTNRDAPKELDATRLNLQKLGYPLIDNPDNLLLRGARKEWGSDKSSRRAYVASSYRVLLLLGDDLNDFVNAREKSAAERDALIKERTDWWGTRWFMIPNPMYGSWEGPITGSSGTPCEQLQKKINALVP